MRRPGQRRRRRPSRKLACCLLGLAATAVVAEIDSQLYTHTLVSDRVNGEHRDLESDFAPVEIGPVTVLLTSPTHTLEVLEHQLSLGPGEDGTDGASLRAKYRGHARLVAELDIAGVGSEIEDQIELPLQETEISGRIEIDRLEDGYRVTTVENPSHVEIQIDSDLAGQLGMLCRGFAVLAMGNVDCDAVDQAMSVLRVPLPEPGEEFFIADGDLTAAERQQIDRYVRDRDD